MLRQGAPVISEGYRDRHPLGADRPPPRLQPALSDRLDEAHWVEFNVAQSELSSGVVSSQLTFPPDGLLRVPDGPGLGVEVNEDFLRERSVSLSAA